MNLDRICAGNRMRRIERRGHEIMHAVQYGHGNAGSAMSDRPCDCGSGKPSRWFRDARQIELFRGCDDCSPAKLSRYRPEVLTDPNYEADEPIEPDDWQLDRRS